MLIITRFLLPFSRLQEDDLPCDSGSDGSESFFEIQIPRDTKEKEGKRHMNSAAQRQEANEKKIPDTQQSYELFKKELISETHNQSTLQTGQQDTQKPRESRFSVSKINSVQKELSDADSKSSINHNKERFNGLPSALTDTFTDSETTFDSGPSNFSLQRKITKESKKEAPKIIADLRKASPLWVKRCSSLQQKGLESSSERSNSQAFKYDLRQRISLTESREQKESGEISKQNVNERSNDLFAYDIHSKTKHRDRTQSDIDSKITSWLQKSSEMNAVDTVEEDALHKETSPEIVDSSINGHMPGGSMPEEKPDKVRANRRTTEQGLGRVGASRTLFEKKSEKRKDLDTVIPNRSKSLSEISAKFSANNEEKTNGDYAPGSSCNYKTSDYFSDKNSIESSKSHVSEWPPKKLEKRNSEQKYIPSGIVRKTKNRFSDSAQKLLSKEFGDSSSIGSPSSPKAFDWKSTLSSPKNVKEEIVHHLSEERGNCLDDFSNETHKHPFEHSPFYIPSSSKISVNDRQVSSKVQYQRGINELELDDGPNRTSSSTPTDSPFYPLILHKVTVQKSSENGYSASEESSDACDTINGHSKSKRRGYSLPQIRTRAESLTTSTVRPLTLQKVVLTRQNSQEDFGFSITEKIDGSGIYVRSIQSQSPAAKPGTLRKYDRILQVSVLTSY